jgi:UDP-N-acetylglucosamine 4,6-dehydratase/5-epimerase
MKSGKTLLITGGTGSFGNAVLRRFLEQGLFSEIRLFSRDEKKQDDMRRFYSSDILKFYIGDTRDSRSVDMAMKGVDFVFHAAALKQVPSCEFFPMEAVRTNIVGCENVLESAILHKVKRVVVLSTDKAVYPINAMGMSKALSEKIMIARSRHLKSSETVICGTRYGNVMASRGSVIPLFAEQMREGKPITITDPEMTRFMMNLDSAVDLVMFAFENGNNGDIFVQKSPSATIDVLAKALLDLYKSNSIIRVIGTRHGEKLYETLVTREEMSKAEDCGQYFRIPADTRDLNYGQFFTEGKQTITEVSDYTSHNTERLDIEGMKALLLELPMIRREVLGEQSKDIFEP